MKLLNTKTIVLLLLSLALVACGSAPAKKRPTSLPTIADLKPAYVGYQSKAKVESVAVAELIQRYEDILVLSQDPAVVKTAAKRLAHLRAIQAEQLQTDSETPEQLAAANQSYSAVIAKFEQLLEQYPDDPKNDEILYQLSKAYDLLGDNRKSLRALTQLVVQFPNSRYRLEAEFRRGELFFSLRLWKPAQASYEYVIANGRDSNFYLNSIYMHGWVLFKRNDYEYALNDFAKVLDIKLGEQAGNVQALDNLKASLSKVDNTLVDDTLRIMSIMFAYVDGGKSIDDLLNRIGNRNYAQALYQGLGELYIGQQRYRDSADTYKAFMKRYPKSEFTPLFQLKVIEAYTAGRFPSLILPEKQVLVESFGVNSDRWDDYSEALKQRLKPELKKHITELAGHYHSRAQALKRKYGREPGRTQQRRINTAFAYAGNWYSEYLDTFPEDEKRVEMTYLLAEVWYEAGRLKAAIRPYEEVAFELPSPEKQAREANYALVVIYQRLIANVETEVNAIKTLTPQQKAGRIKQLKKALAQRQLEIQEKFVARFYQDKRALVLALNIAQQYLQTKQFDKAIPAAQRVLAWQEPKPTPRQQLTALLVLGHSEFDLERYSAAEKTYYKVVKLLAKKDARRKQIRERIAASIYQQGEILAANGQLEAAIVEFQRVGKTIPESKIRTNADYDAATYLLQLKNWPQAVKALVAFKRNYPKHAFSQDIPAKLVLAYQSLKQWDKAAAQLGYIWRNDKDPVAQRQALFQSAQLYQKAGKSKSAIDAYRSYAHKYPEPFGPALEARYELTELYKKQRDESKRRYWLKKIIVLDAKAGTKRTDRSRYLAASASMVFADDQRWAFNRIKLSIPLAKSLKKKKKAFDSALKAYKKTIDYGVEAFATKSTYRIAEIYRRLSEDMMDSQRPNGLSELELEQYELLLEEQAYPFEENAIEIHVANSERSQQGNYDDWVKASFKILRGLMPARFNKVEQQVGSSEYIY